MDRPGIMVYFDMMGPLSKLQDADKGRLFWAMLAYGKTGVLPVFNGVALELAWEFVKPKIDKDHKEYIRSVQRRQYATACRERKKKGEPDITFDEWLKLCGGCDNHDASMMTNDNQWYPTTTTPTTTSTSTNTSTPTSTAAAATTTEPEEFTAATAADKKFSFLGGKLGKGVVLLTDEQIEALLDTLGIDAFDFYVEKLADFILKNDAKVKDHYGTILKWWEEDRTIKRSGIQKQEIPKGASGVLGDAELEAIQRLFKED